MPAIQQQLKDIVEILPTVVDNSPGEYGSKFCERLTHDRGKRLRFRWHR